MFIQDRCCSLVEELRVSQACRVLLVIVKSRTYLVDAHTSDQVILPDQTFLRILRRAVDMSFEMTHDKRPDLERQARVARRPSSRSHCR